MNNDIDLKRWREYGHILTDSLWLFPRSDGQSNFHGAFIPQVARQLIERYTKKGDVIVDMFLGSGTTAIEAIKMGRKCIGVDLQIPESLSSDLLSIDQGAQFELGQADSKSDGALRSILFCIDKLAGKDSGAQLVILHPPYHNIIKFSDDPLDLSNSTDTEAFMSAFEAVACSSWWILEEGGFAAVVIGDKYANGELIPLGFKCLEVMSKVGFKLKSIAIKDIQGNQRGKGKDANLWRYRALAGGFHIFKHEYILVMFK